MVGRCHFSYTVHYQPDAIHSRPILLRTQRAGKQPVQIDVLRERREHHDGNGRFTRASRHGFDRDLSKYGTYTRTNKNNYKKKKQLIPKRL